MLHRWCSYCVVLGLGTLVAGPAAAAPESGADDTDVDEASASEDDPVEPPSDAKYEILDEPDVEGELIEPDDDAGDGQGLAATPSEPMVEIIAKDKKVRHDWYIGFGIGVGVGASFVQGTNELGLTVEPGAKPGGTGFVHIGGRVREKLSLGGRIATVAGGVAGGTSLMAEALYFPIKDRGLVLGAAVGPSVIYAVADPAKDRLRRPGAGLAVDIGYDFWLLRRLNLGIVLQANAVLNRKQASAVAGTLGLQLNWY